MENVVIIGKGPAIYMAAVYAHTANLSPLIIETNLPNSPILFSGHDKVAGVKNIKTPMELIDRLRAQCDEFGIRRIAGEIEAVQYGDKTVIISTDEKKLETKTVIIDDEAVLIKCGVKIEEEINFEKLESKGIVICGRLKEKLDEAIILIGGGCKAAFRVKEYLDDYEE